MTIALEKNRFNARELAAEIGPHQTHTRCAGLFFGRCVLASGGRSGEGQKRVVSDLDGVDVEDTLAGWDESEVDDMGERPHGPVDLHRGPQLVGHLLLDLVGFPVHGLHGGEEHCGEHGGTGNLVDDGFGGDGGGAGGRLDHDGAVEEAVPVVAHGAVEAHAERAHLRGALHVPRLAGREIRRLRHHIAQHEPGERLRARVC